MAGLKVIAFDADDTLWINEPLFRRAEEEFCRLLSEFMPEHSVSRELLRIEIANLPLYGYGIKSFMLSMVEAAISVSGGAIPSAAIDLILAIGKEMLDEPLILLEGVEDLLGALQEQFLLVVATKGDLLDQERKLEKSGLAGFFHHIEIMSEKRERDYLKLLRHLDLRPEEFLMVGNSLKSDALPVLALGGHAVHVPFHTTWEHEVIDYEITHPLFHRVESLAEAAGVIARLQRKSEP